MRILHTVTYVKPLYTVRICILYMMLIQDQKIPRGYRSIFNSRFLSRMGALVTNTQSKVRPVSVGRPNVVWRHGRTAWAASNTVTKLALTKHPIEELPVHYWRIHFEGAYSMKQLVHWNHSAVTISCSLKLDNWSYFLYFSTERTV